LLKKNYSFFPVYLTYFLDNFGLAIIYPIFTPIFLLPNALISSALAYAHRTLLLGILIGLFPLAQLIASPLLGQFSDRFGRKRAFYITIFGTAIGYTLTAISIGIHSLTMLFLSRFLTGLFASNLTLCLAAVVDMSPNAAARARNFGHIAAIGGISFIVAIAVGGILSDPSLGSFFNPSFPFWFTALLAYINFICMILLFHETHQTNKPLDFHPFKGMHNILLAIKNKELSIIYLGNFFFMLSWVASMQFMPTFLIQQFSFSTLNVAFALIAVGALWSFSNFVVNRQLAKRFYPANTLNVCLFFLFLLLLSIIFVDRPVLFFLLFYPAVCFASLCWTNSLANISLKAPPSIQGSILGINQSMTSLAAMIAPPIGGLFAGAGKNWMYSFTALSSFLAFAILWHSQHRFSQRI
jgi:DHA1 family tetracycline resistance protein-like MFS transporter